MYTFVKPLLFIKAIYFIRFEQVNLDLNKNVINIHRTNSIYFSDTFSLCVVISFFSANRTAAKEEILAATGICLNNSCLDNNNRDLRLSRKRECSCGVWSSIKITCLFCVSPFPSCSLSIYLSFSLSTSTRTTISDKSRTKSEFPITLHGHFNKLCRVIIVSSSRARRDSIWNY